MRRKRTGRTAPSGEVEAHMTRMKRDQRLLFLCTLFAATVNAQCLNYREPGAPRTHDGKPNLIAPALKALDGKPDLSGVWLHEKTSAEEMKRLFGNLAEKLAAVDVPGMEFDRGHKYAFDILLDHKPEEGLVRPEILERMPRRGSLLLDSNVVCTP